MAIAAGSSSSGGSSSTGLRGGGGGASGGSLRYRALKYVGGGGISGAEENEAYFADGENDPSSTPLNKFDMLKSNALMCVLS